MPKVWKGKAKVKPKTAKVPKATKKYVKTMISKRKPLRSFGYNASAGAEVTSTAVISDLTAIALNPGGDDPEGYRSQQQLKPMRLDLSGVWAPKATASTDNYMRLIIFIWPEDRDGNEPTAAQVFGDNFTYPYLTPRPFGDIDTANGTVLYDRLFHLAPHYDGASKVSGLQSLPIRKTIYLGKRPMIRYLSNTGTGGKNHIYCLVVGNSATGTSSSTLQLYTQLHYQE